MWRCATRRGMTAGSASTTNPNSCRLCSTSSAAIAAKSAGKASHSKLFAVLKEGVSHDGLRRLEDLGVTMTQDYAWFYKGEPYSPVQQKKDSMSRFADQYISSR